jgi:hypothetical protein
MGIKPLNIQIDPLSIGPNKLSNVQMQSNIEINQSNKGKWRASKGVRR